MQAVTDAGNPILSDVAPGADLRTDLPLYRVFRHGVLAEEVTDISHLWTEDMVGFVLGCSFSFEEAMLRVRARATPAIAAPASAALCCADDGQ